MPECVGEALVRLAIVGSRELHGRRDAADAICQVIEHYKPAIVVSGGARGIDRMAVLIAKYVYKVAIKEHLPQVEQFDDYNGLRGYRTRDHMIAEDCDALVRIKWAGTKTYGSGLTRDWAAKRGVPTQEIVIE